MSESCQSHKCFICLRPKYVFTIALYVFYKAIVNWKVNMLTHLVAPYHVQTTRDVRDLNMYSECKSRVEARPLAAVWGPYIQFLILTLLNQWGISSTPVLLLPPCPPPFPALWTSQDPWGHQNVNWASNLLFHLPLSVMITKNQCRNNGIRNIWLILCTVSFWYCS